ncbi:DeoR/GlpR family DNA-binding transcription regulator [Nocardiopsis ansamitocini]|uniref:Lactose phosphotransferase system repressor n=1 Tax=Nocardiopsis ansamitocini TaxID=1670832 RepID=A0A9W6P3I2_9ACTN|nr:DeoR/GlpR family DNA-binding transcription regulator [Nocardiopsis ansamitocini]GLU46560.1 DeoR family transcriptional regulator [Nocardiopsis ansamitocini]
MHAAERHQRILTRAREEGRVEVKDLASRLSVTPETIRRDLTSLDRRGLLHRLHGGAVPTGQLPANPGVGGREETRSAEKGRIARAALAQVPDNGTVILDSGTTTGRIADLLPADRELTVVTHSVPIAAKLARNPAITLHLLGGRVHGRTMAAVGPWAFGALDGLFVDTAFIGADAICATRGLSTAEADEAQIKRALITAARRTVLLADRTKFGRTESAYFSPIEDIDLVICDSGLDTGVAEEIEAAGPRIEFA